MPYTLGPVPAPAITYLEDTYIPVLPEGFGGWTWTGDVSPASGYYVKIGSMVNFAVEIDFTNVTSFGSGQLTFTLPSIPYGDMINIYSGILIQGSIYYVIRAHNTASSNTALTFYTASNATSGNPTSERVLSQANLTMTTAGKLYIQGSYKEA